ncbi:hypothetical protein A2296_01750, partial [candidate division CPR3 bacterium RIFOXYB2_FULL_35_8]
MNVVKIYGLALVVFLAIDFLWLSLIAKDFYGEHLGFLMRDDPNLLAALIFYLLFVGGIVFFVIMPNKEQGSLTTMLLSGMFFGLVSYATYDLTNYATIKDWPFIIVVVDLAWGAIISGFTTTV